MTLVATSAKASGSSGGAIALLASQVLTGVQATFDTNTILGGNIPTGANHLKVVLYGRGDNVAAQINLVLKLNNDAGGNYYRENILGNTATPTAAEFLAETGAICGFIPAAGAIASNPGMLEMLIPQYNAATFFKTAFVSGGQSRATLTGNQYVYANAITWDNTAAITRLSITPAAGNFLAGSAFYLYGLT